MKFPHFMTHNFQYDIRRSTGATNHINEVCILFKTEVGRIVETSRSKLNSESVHPQKNQPPPFKPLSSATPLKHMKANCQTAVTPTSRWPARLVCYIQQALLAFEPS